MNGRKLPPPERGGLIVNRRKFHQAIKRAVKAYAVDVRAGKNDRRRNFVRKMNYLGQPRHLRLYPPSPPGDSVPLADLR
jgi:hypothetical protein